jgi:hypothetical protein
MRIERDLTCPTCGRVNQVHDEVHAEVPGDPGIEAGDVSVCWGCAEPAIFTPGGQLRAASPDERADLAHSGDLAGIQAAIRAAATPSQAIDVLRGSS